MFNRSLNLQIKGMWLYLTIFVLDSVGQLFFHSHTEYLLDPYHIH